MRPTYRCRECLDGPRPMPNAGRCAECNRRMVYVRRWRARSPAAISAERERLEMRVRLLNYIIDTTYPC